jgi:hypothetical protein
MDGPEDIPKTRMQRRFLGNAEEAAVQDRCASPGLKNKDIVGHNSSLIVE